MAGQFFFVMLVFCQAGGVTSHCPASDKHIRYETEADCWDAATLLLKQAPGADIACVKAIGPQ